jgi:hypothetical protein
MPNLQTRGASTHVSRLQKAAGELVKYRRGSSYVELIAAIGGTVFDEVIGDGETTTETKSIDFIFATDELVLGGKVINPKRGDVVDRENGERYDVMPGTNTAPSRWNDGRRNLHRVHTVRRVKSD